MPNRILTSIADLFQRGLESLATYFFAGRSKQPTLKDAINARLQQTNEEAAGRTITVFGQRVQQAEIAADVLSQIGTVDRATVPKAPGLNFTNPETGELSDTQTVVVVETGVGEEGSSTAVTVYHDPQATWEQIKDEALRLAQQIANQ